jgi:transcriptional regulator with XRE-family HTH domain
MYKQVGVILKALRLETNLNLRKFCHRHDLDASVVSKIERGVYGRKLTEQETVQSLPLIHKGDDLDALIEKVKKND